LPPLELHRAWHVSVPLNFGLFEATGQAFVGTHDFSGFAAKRGKKEEDTIRTIRSVRVRKRGFVVNIEIDGDGFLYKMVRLMVGAMVRAGLGQMNRSEVVNQLKLGRAGASRYAAPAGGLYLVRVWY
jgi:tRNA pseudouridine38-40 synthase